MVIHSNMFHERILVVASEETCSRNKFNSFEYIDILAKCSTGCVRIVTSYRPQPSKANHLNSALFFEEFCTLAERLVVSPGNLLIVGDFTV